MSRAFIGVCTLELDLPELESLSAKRAIISGLIRQLQQRFKVSAAEIAEQNRPDAAVVAFAVVSGASAQAHTVITSVITWIDDHYTDVVITEQTIEIL